MSTEEPYGRFVHVRIWRGPGLGNRPRLLYMKAMIFILWPQAVHTDTSIWKTRESRAAQVKRYLVEPVFFLSSEGVFPVLSAGTTFARCLELGARIP